MPSENSPGKNTKTYLEEKKIHQGYETFLELYKIGMIYDELLTAYNSGEIIPDSKLYNSMIGLAGREKIMPGDKIWILKLLPNGKSFPSYVVNDKDDLSIKGNREVTAVASDLLKGYWRIAPK
jgi:hypothetical protein